MMTGMGSAGEKGSAHAWHNAAYDHPDLPYLIVVLWAVH
jgi:hypothetical protein